MKCSTENCNNEATRGINDSGICNTCYVVIHQTADDPKPQPIDRIATALEAILELARDNQ